MPPVHDKLENLAIELREDASGCPYQGHEFGAHYPDSVCIEGYLWDADSGDASGEGSAWVFTSGGDIACPHCNHAQWLASALEELEEAGYDAQSQGLGREACPHPEKSRFEHEGPLYREAWLRGWDSAPAA